MVRLADAERPPAEHAGNHCSMYSNLQCNFLHSTPLPWRQSPCLAVQRFDCVLARGIVTMGNTPSGTALYQHRQDDAPVGYRVMTVQPGGPAADVRVLKVGVSMPHE